MLYIIDILHFKKKVLYFNDIVSFISNTSREYKYVTGSEKTAHFAHDFKIELLVLQERVALKQ